MPQMLGRVAPTDWDAVAKLFIAIFPEQTVKLRIHSTSNLVSQIHF